MYRSLAFVSAVALAAAVSGCGLFNKEDRNNPPPATSAAPQPAPAPAQTSMNSNSSTHRAGASRTGASRTSMSRTHRPEQTASATASRARSPDEVRKVQSALNENGEDVKVDGRWGPQTSQALRDYQQKNGLQASGHLDDQTKQKLNVDTSNNPAQQQ
jgi:murein L,D-transpeptidase YcbB/YkuD